MRDTVQQMEGEEVILYTRFSQFPWLGGGGGGGDTTRLPSISSNRFSASLC